jgi:hypothetical protein
VQVFSRPDCSKKFVEEKSLALHLRAYNGVKHFSCSQCVRSTHMSILDEEKPYSKMPPMYTVFYRA